MFAPLAAAPFAPLAPFAITDLEVVYVLKWIVLGGTLAFALAWLLGEAIVSRWRGSSPNGARRFYGVVTRRRAKYISLFDGESHV